MTLFKSAILCVFLISVTSANLMNSNLKSATTLSNDWVQIFPLCYANSSNPIVVTSNLADSARKNLPDAFAPAIVLNDDFFSKRIPLFLPNYPIFILSVSKVEELSDLVREIKSSLLWSINSKFFVIGNSERFCSDALPFLKELWKFELLSSAVVCQEAGNTYLYSYNPYANRVPHPAFEVEGSHDPSERWTLYKTPLRDQTLVCDVLSFDKTKILDGYPVKIWARDHDPKYLDHILSTLNVTVEKTFSKPINVSVIEQTFISSDDDINSDFDAISTRNSHLDVIPSACTNIHFTLVTRKRSFSSPLSDISIPFNLTVAIVTISVILMITVLITLNNRYDIIAAFRNIWLLLLRMGLDVPLDQLSMKLTFFAGLFFVVYFSPIIEANIFSILASPRLFRNVETFEDLYENRYHLYYPAEIKDVINEQNIWRTHEDIKYLHSMFVIFPQDCLDLASKNNTVACLWPTEFILNEVFRLNLHMANNFFFESIVYHFTRQNWPLSKIFELKTQALFETGRPDYAKRQLVGTTKKTMKSSEKLKKAETSADIDFDNLIYLYTFVAFSHILANLVFCVEHFFEYCRQKRK